MGKEQMIERMVEARRAQVEAREFLRMDGIHVRSFPYGVGRFGMDVEVNDWQPVGAVEPGERLAWRATSMTAAVREFEDPVDAVVWLVAGTTMAQVREMRAVLDGVVPALG